MTAGRIRRWLGGRHAPLAIGAISIALLLPALAGEFVADDHLQRLLLRDDPGIAGLEHRPLDLFVFADGDPDRNRALVDAGVFPWWTGPEARLAFMRPLASATHALDHAVWPESPTAALVHNVLWYALALVAVWAFYRRFVDVRWLAVLAFLVYALDDARGPPVSWIANRNAIIALALAIPVLLAHDRWRRRGWSPGRFVALALLAVALLAGESAVGIGAYLFAHAVFIDRGPWRDRVAALLPYLGIVVLWRIVYVALGYGVSGSGIYIDPGADPLGFAAAAAIRLPLLLLGQLALPWSDLSVLYPFFGDGVLVGMALGAVAFLALFTVAAWPLLRADPVSRFFAAGMVLAAVPVCSTFAADRLLWFVGLGGAGLVARLIGAAFTERGALGASRLRRWLAVSVAVLLLVINVVLSPLMLLSRSRSMIDMGGLLETGTNSIPADPSITDKTVVLVNSPADPIGAYVQLTRESRGEPRPRHLRWLSTGRSDVLLERLDAHTLRVRPDDGFVAHEMDHMLHDPSRRFAVGERIELSDLTIEVESLTADRRPQAVTVRFRQPLEDPRHVWMRWGVREFVPYQPPAPGQGHVLPAVDYQALLDPNLDVEVPPVEPVRRP